jgi:hypothetical protein
MQQQQQQQQQVMMSVMMISAEVWGLPVLSLLLQRQQCWQRAHMLQLLGLLHAVLHAGISRVSCCHCQVAALLPEVLASAAVKRSVTLQGSGSSSIRRSRAAAVAAAALM